MSFSLFTFLFLGSVIILYYILHKELRQYVLLAASLFYAWHLSVRAFIVVCATCVLVYAAGLAIAACNGRGKKTAARNVFVVAVALCIGALFLCKLPHFILTIGFSYYIFQAVAYLTGVWKKEISVEKNPAVFALFLCYFPKFVSGPIEEPLSFLPQIKKLKEVRLFDFQRLSLAFTDLLYGYFLKLVIADRLGLLTSTIFYSYKEAGAFWLVIGSLLYTLQLYADFAGYSAIAVGVSRIFGIDLIYNFEAPYLSLGITEFWRRWHRSLSAWLRKYVYIPLGGNRKGPGRKCIHTVIVFFLCGLWHGNGLHFVVWGLLHALYSVIETLARKDDKPVPPARQIIGRALTFCGVSFAWIFFGSPSLADACGYILRIVTLQRGAGGIGADRVALGLSGLHLLLSFVFVVGGILFDAMIYRTGKPFAFAVGNLHYALRYLLWYLLIVVIFVFGIYGGGYDTAAFMYMEF